jgi:hypothetical protein
MIFIYIDVNYRSYVTKEKDPTSLELKVEKNNETLTIDLSVCFRKLWESTEPNKIVRFGKRLESVTVHIPTRNGIVP